MLWYCPLEPLRERYTMQLSAPKTGWYEREWTKHGIEYTRIPSTVHLGTEIRVGQVLDAIGRCRNCFSQIEHLLCAADRGLIKNTDVIYFDDFWHPGIEALGYCFAQMCLHPKMYAFCWAQSVDEFDFTYSMRHWMSHYERGNMALLDGVFVANTLLKDLLVKDRQFSEHEVHVVGLPFCSEEVMSRMPKEYQAFSIAPGGRPYPRQNKVVFSSRWDTEKNPGFFMDVVLRILERRRDIQFVICTSAPKLRSNDPLNLQTLYEAMSTYPSNIFLKEGLTKEQYYEELCSAKVQINTASQDWISFTLLEAAVAGCVPIYPCYRSFPETFIGEHSCLYEAWNSMSAVELVLDALNSPDEWWDYDSIQRRSWIYKRFDSTWARQAQIMGYDVTPEIKDPYNRQEVLGD